MNGKNNLERSSELSLYSKDLLNERVPRYYSGNLLSPCGSMNNNNTNGLSAE
jgi:hypothetical protein